MTITDIGARCLHCSGSVEGREHKPGWKPRCNQPYYFKRWLKCNKCSAVYHFESEKVWLVEKPISKKERVYAALDRAIAKDKE